MTETSLLLWTHYAFKKCSHLFGPPCTFSLYCENLKTIYKLEVLIPDR